jgi:hypothetical protein
MSLDITAAQAVLKETYPNGIVPIDYDKTKTLALFRKEKGTIIEGPFGAGFAQPLKYGNPQAVSATFATGYAQAASEASRYARWFLTPGEVFAFARVQGALIRRSQGSGSFIKALVSEIENAKKALTRQLEILLDGNGWGNLGKISGISTVTITLQYPWMARHFEVGQSLVSSSSINGAVLSGSGTPIKIAKVNTGVGTLTMASSAAAWGSSDYLFLDGCRQNSSTPSRIVPCGFESFLHDADADLETLFTVDQTISTRLGGIRRSATASGNMEEALLDLSADIDAAGGKSTHCVLGSQTYARLCKSLLNKVYCDIEDLDGVKLGFKGIVLQGASGDVIVYSDSAFNEGRGRMFNIDDVGIIHTGDDLVYLEQTDGLQFRQIDGTDDWMARLIASHQFHLDAPGHAGVVTDL